MAVFGLLKLFTCALVMFETMTRMCHAASASGYCAWRTCGGVSIRFPFTLQDDYLSDLCYSGYPNLAFLCLNESLYLNFTSNGTYLDDMYTVTAIDYWNQTLTLVPDGTSICRAFDANRFGGLNVTNTTTLLLDCPSNYVPPIVTSCSPLANYSEACASNGTNVTAPTDRWICEVNLEQYTDSALSSCHLFDSAPTQYMNLDPAGSTALVLQFGGNRSLSYLNGTAFEDPPSPAPSPGPKSSKKTGLYIILGGLLAAIAIFFFCMLYWCRRSRHSSSRTRESFTRKNVEAFGKMKAFHSSLSQKNHPTTLYTLKELERATKNFSDDCRLGSGGYGTVFKGTCDDGVEVAIKRTNRADCMKGVSEQFINEVTLLSQVNHRNLVRLHGCCLEVEVPMLVYEYVSNGDLFQHLHGEQCPGTLLSWEMRMQIAIDSAEALRYLHSAAHPPIYHRDIKTSNILLDDNFNVKVADFGISRLVKPDATHVSTAVQGTPGYLDPEYFRTLQLTDKSDVYSFGMVLLELVTSLKPVDLQRGGDDANLMMMALPFIQKGNVKAIADARLLDESVCESVDIYADQMQRVGELALKCLADSRHRRPTMKEVVAELVTIRGVENRSNHDSSRMSEMDIMEVEIVPVLGNQSSNFTSSSDSTTTRYSTSPTAFDEVKRKTR